MPIPLAILAAMYGPAAIAGIGATAKGLQKYGPQIRGGINTLSKWGQSPWLTRLAERIQQGYATQGGKFGNLFSQLATPGGMQSGNPMNIKGLETIKEGSIDFPQEVMDDKEFWKEMFDKYLVSEDKKKEKKKKKKKEERTESRKKQRIKEKKKKEPSLDLVEMNKGGDVKKKKKKYAKKQRKRKHYRASGFVKMKKKKKYIT